MSSGVRGVRCLLAVCTASSIVVLAPPAPAASPGRLLAPGPLGTVETVAGPEVCDGLARPDLRSIAVGALAADLSGSLWYESDGAQEDLVTTVSNSASVVVHRLAAPRMTADERGRRRTSSSSSLASDGRGSLLIARPSAVLSLVDGGLTPLAGTLSPLAASENGQDLGDGGPFRSARFQRIGAIAADPEGNVYVADEIDDATSSIAIRFLNRSDRAITFYPGSTQEITIAPGVIDTIAGARRQVAGQSPLEAAAPALTVAGGRLYLAATLPSLGPSASVRLLNLTGEPLSTHGKTTAPGEISTVATVTGVAGTAANTSVAERMSALPGIAADSEGNLFLAEQTNHRITRLDQAGTMSTVAGTGAPGFDGNDRTAVQSRLDRPSGVAIGSGGRLYISDTGNAQVRVVDRAGTIRAALGNGAGLRLTCQAVGDVPAPAAVRAQPVGIAGDASGTVYMTSGGTGQVHALGTSGDVRPVSESATGEQTRQMGQPAAMTLGRSGGLYVRDETGVYVINVGRNPLEVHGQIVAAGATARVVGTGVPADPSRSSGEGSSALDASLASQRGGAVVADERGNLLLGDHDPSDPVRGRVRQVDPQGVITTLLEGSGRAADGRIDTGRCCGFVRGLVADGAGNLYIADASLEFVPAGPGRLAESRQLGRVWFFNRSDAPVSVHGVVVPPGEVDVIAGAGSAGSEQEDVPARQASLTSVGDLALDGAANLYVISAADHTVRRVDGRGLLSTVAGTGQASFNGDGLKGRLTALDQPTVLAIDACGNLLIADTGNDRVRRLNLVSSCPPLTSPVAAPGSADWSVSLLAALAAVGTVLALAAGWRFALLSRRRAGRSGPHRTPPPPSRM